jgi:outer membrane protein assembly factor BamB
MKRTGSILLVAACLCGQPPGAWAADWPQYRGLQRDGVSPETGLLKTWPREGPRLLWTFKNAGQGYSGPAVVGGTIYLMGTRGSNEVLLALDEAGQERWAATIAPIFDFKSNQWSRGPNATPSVDGGLVYALGSQGMLLCAQADSGKEVWRKDLPREMGAEVNPIGGGPEKFGWGFSWSPLVDGEQLVIVPGGPGGLLAALDKKTGKVLWRSKGAPEQATYSSPVVLSVGGVRQYVQLTQEGVVGVDARTGEVLWSYKRATPFPDVVCPTPLVKDDKVYVTAWGANAELLQIVPEGKAFQAKVVWSEKEISNIQGGVVLVGGYVYGYHAERAWQCQDFASGEVKWAPNRRALPAGSLLAADGMLYCLSEKGGKGLVALVAATPAKYTEKGRFSLPEAAADRKSRGGVWTHPVLSDGRLYLRDQELLFCYQVK